MIAYTVFLLFIIGIFSSLKVGVKVDKVLAFVTFASLFLVFLNFCDNMMSAIEHSFTFEWSTSPGRDLKLEMLSNPATYGLVLPCFIITLLACLNNLLFRYEERRSAYSAVLIFNLSALIILITSNNFVQLISALFVVDILSLFLIKDTVNCQRYVMLNMCADMILFSVLAVINSRVNSLDIQEIWRYRQIGFHADFAALAGLTAIFAKLGFAVFQIGIMPLSNIRFHRIQNVLFLSSPLAALILLMKFNGLWRISDYFTHYADAACFLTLIWAFIGSICTNNYKAKAIYWQMSFWSLMVALLRFYGFVWIPEFTCLLVEMYALICAVYLIYFYNNRGKTVTYMMNLRLTHKKRLISCFCIILLSLTAMANTLMFMYNNVNRWCIWTFAILFLLSLASTLGQIYFHKGKRNVGVQHNICFKWWVLLELLTLCGGVLYAAQITKAPVWGTALAFTLLVLLPIWHKTAGIYEIEFLQNNDILSKIYKWAIKSLRLSGRVFWLLIDRLFLEKIVLETAIIASKVSLRLFRRLHNNGFVGALFIAAVLILLLYFSAKQGGLIHG
ncbi:MAG: hypothetical protein IKN71_04175 [Alphaproteobacteria bacterium]|nr:hypothetical protein [Alphaproteobacteria bacterium]